MALILLGASFARMKIPRPFRKMPLPAMFWVLFCKLALLPVIGILLTQALTHHSVIPKDALVEVGCTLSFVASIVDILYAAFCCYTFERNTVSCEVSIFL